MRIRRLPIRLAALSLAMLALSFSSSRAADILINGGSEEGAGPQSWAPTQSTAPTPPPGDYNGNGMVDAADYVKWRVTNQPASDYTQWRANFGSVAMGQPVAATELIASAQESTTITGLGLLVKPTAGNDYPYLNQNLPVSFSMTQTFTAGPSAPGKTYTFSGDSAYQGAYSGNLDTLYADSPSGAIASPTQTQYQLSFLDSASHLLSTTILNLPKHRVDPGGDNPPAWQTDSVSAIAPTSTFKVQVTVAATNMVASCTTACPFGQDVRFDNFSLKDNQVVTEHLLNGTIDAPGSPSGWSLHTVGNDVVQFSNGDFARHSGNVGMWLRAFQGNQPNPPTNNPGPIDGDISQIVAASAGTSYTFSAWVKLQAGYSGLDPNSGTQTFLKMEFLNGSGGTIGSPVSLEMGPHGPLGQNFWPAGPDNGQGVWENISLAPTVAPFGTASIKVTGGASGMIFEPDAAAAGLVQSALFDEFSLIAGGSGNGNLLTGALAAAVPEPATGWLFLMALAGGLGMRRRQ